MGLFGGNSSDGKGYNVTDVSSLRDDINKTAKDSEKVIIDILKQDIIVPMSKAWYAPEAVDFFAGFKGTVKLSGDGIQKAFDAFREAIQKAGENWAENTKGEKPVLTAIDEVVLDLDVSAIEPKNSKGDVIIYENAATAVANSLGETETKIKTEMEKLAKDLDADTAFIGGEQAEAIEKCFTDLSGEIHKIFKYLTEGAKGSNPNEDVASLQAQIQKAVKKYGDVASGISSAFNSSTTSQS